jgi:predicted Zn-dependent peptidase
MDRFKKRKLKNGITVLFEKRDLPLVSVSITNRFGAGYEESEIKGIAHFIEHLVFTGTATRTHEDISREIEKKGGVLNAFTWHEVTSFFFKLPSEHLFRGFDILVDILKNPKFDKDKFEKERKVILEEIKVYRDNPRSAVNNLIEKQMYEKPFGELVIGNEESLEKLERDFVYEYFKKHYNPENYIVTVVGDADIEKVCEYLEENFKSLRKSFEMKDVIKKKGEEVEERQGIDQAHFVLGMHAPLPSENDFYVLEVLDGYLGSGMSSRLFLEIREKRGLAYTVNSSIDSEKNWSAYQIYVGTTKDKVEEVKKIILEEFGKLSEMSEKDLEEAKERVIGLRKVVSEESISVMNALMFSELVGSAEDYYKFESKVREVKLEEVKRLANEMIKDYSTAAVLPK